MVPLKAAKQPRALTLSDGTLTDRVFAEVQSAERMMELLGYLPQAELVRK